jgi:4-amino-4-deoxy-L-arabinose transferase-like glycosyltransferase
VNENGRSISEVVARTPATWVLILTTVFLSRFAWSPAYLSTDTVNLAYALESFDPTSHQPQPPGYPLFVILARAVDWFLSRPEISFWIISIAATVAAAAVLYLLADRMMSRWAAVAVVILFLLNPILWFSRLRSPLRPWLALFSSLVAYCAWRCWNGERRFVWWGALALGIGAGFRPDLLAYLFPLWAVSAWKATRSWLPIIKGCVLVTFVSMIWFAPVVYTMGGLAASVQTVTGYLEEQSSKDSVLFAEIESWFRPVSRLVIWNAMAVVGWIWVPFIVSHRSSVGRHPRWPFLLVWVGPGLLIQVLVHIAAPGHTLFATPVWCVMGAYFLSKVRKHRDVLLAIAASANAALFLNAIPLGYPPSADASRLEQAMISVKNAVAYGTFETSMDRLRWWDEMTQASIQELQELSVPDRPNLIVMLNGNEKEFDFMNWRVASYYLTERPLWVLLDNLQAGADRIRLVRRENMRTAGRDSLSFPGSARLLWVVLPGGTFHAALEKVKHVQRGRYILYTDPPYDAPFRIEGFEFVPR